VRTIVVATILSLAVIACSVDNSGNTNVECRALSAEERAPSCADSPFHGTVFTIVLENKSRAQILEGTKAPYLRRLGEDNAVAAGYLDAKVHPSEANYIWMVSGQNFGILDDDDPISHHVASTSHLADQIERAGMTWKAYQESMGEPCMIVASSDGLYRPKHNPFVYFDDIVGWDGTALTRQQRCRDHVVDYSQLDADLAAGTVPDYVFITPNMIDDMHDGSIEDGDAWFAREVPKILASDAYQNGGVLFITADEGDGRSLTDWSQEDDPPFIIASPLGKKQYVSTTSFDTSSYLKTVQAVLGVEPLPCDGAPDAVDTMQELFEVPLPELLPSTAPL
jgi:acid phosphatase